MHSQIDEIVNQTDRALATGYVEVSPRLAVRAE